MTYKQILSYIFVIIALIFEAFFGIISFVYFFIQIILIAFSLFLIVSIFRRNTFQNWKGVIARYIFVMIATIGFFTSFMLLFVQYQYLTPGVVSDIVLTHSGQKIVFVEMSHIATSGFFAQKKETIRSLYQSGYTILYEGVRPGSPKNQAIFDAAMGFELTPILYHTIADLIGLQSQDNHLLFADMATGSLVSVDLSIDDIVGFMATGSQNQTQSLSIPDIESEIQSSIKKLSPHERIWMSWLGRGLLNWSLRRSEDLSDLLTIGSQGQLFSTIIDRRNDAIVTYIQTHPTEHIAVIYGALHFNGVYESLQRLDPKWKIESITNTEPYTK